MAQTQISDVVVPAKFTAYQVENSMVSYGQHSPLPIRRCASKW